ncbi:hypothetical protein [Catenovulum agarivorans]|nr:hypothetical protein [Catenovulum agarivorans]
MQAISSASLDPSQAKQLANKLAQSWLAPAIANNPYKTAFITLPIALPRLQKRYLSTCTLLLHCADIFQLHPKLVHKLLIAASLRDIALTKTQKQSKLDNKTLIASATASASQLQQLGFSALVPLVAKQYQLPPNMLFSQTVFSLVCKLVHQQNLLSLANWRHILKAIMTTEGHKLPIFWLDKLYLSLGPIPPGSYVADKQQSLYWVMSAAQANDHVVCLSTSGIWQLKSTENLTITDSEKYLKPQELILCCQHKSTELIRLDQTSEVNNFSLTQLTHLLGHFHQHKRDPVSLLSDDITNLPTVRLALCRYASELAQTSTPIEKTKHAIMMLGLGRVYYWLIRYQIETYYLKYTYDQQNLHLLYLKQAQSVAERLVQTLGFIETEQAKLLVTLAFMPYLNAPKIQTKVVRPQLISISPAQIFAQIKTYPQALIKTLTEQLRIEHWCADALVALNSLADLPRFNLKTQQTCALLICACSSVGLSYNPAEIGSTQLPTELSHALSLLKLDFTSLQQIQLENSQDNNLYSPLPRLIR